MPYIKEDRRKEFLIYGTGSHPVTAGELNYVLTCVALQYVKDIGESYQTYNDILGAFDGAAKELYRRRVAPYEDKKCLENGDIS